MKTILSQVDELPPFLCYIAAHRGKAVRPSLYELCEAAGMSQRTFSRIVCRSSWAGVTMKRMDQISRACGVDLLNPKEVWDWILEEVAKPEPFIALNQRGGPRKKMLAKVNMICAKVLVAQK